MDRQLTHVAIMPVGIIDFLDSILFPLFFQSNKRNSINATMFNPTDPCGLLGVNSNQRDCSFYGLCYNAYIPISRILKLSSITLL